MAKWFALNVEPELFNSCCFSIVARPKVVHFVAIKKCLGQGQNQFALSGLVWYRNNRMMSPRSQLPSLQVFRIVPLWPGRRAKEEANVCKKQPHHGGEKGNSNGFTVANKYLNCSRNSSLFLSRHHHLGSSTTSAWLSYQNSICVLRFGLLPRHGHHHVGRTRGTSHFHPLLFFNFGGQHNTRNQTDIIDIRQLLVRCLIRFLNNQSPKTHFSPILLYHWNNDRYQRPQQLDSLLRWWHVQCGPTRTFHVLPPSQSSIQCGSDHASPSTYQWRSFEQSSRRRCWPYQCSPAACKSSIRPAELCLVSGQGEKRETGGWLVGWLLQQQQQTRTRRNVIAHDKNGSSLLRQSIIIWPGLTSPHFRVRIIYQ